MIDLRSFEIFCNTQETLRNISKDNSDSENIQYMVNSTQEAVNFDLVKRKYTNRLGHSEEDAASVDALTQLKDGALSFIEFKNGKVSSREIKHKIRDSLLIFFDIVKRNADFSRNYMDFVLVYNSQKNPPPNQLKKGKLQEAPSRITIGNYFLNKADKELILFDLERYQGLYFRRVHTYTAEKFQEKLADFV